MKKFYLSFFIAITLFFSACNNSTNTNTEKKTKSDNIISLSLSEFNQKAGNYIGKSVQVTGIVDHVCKHGGKKLLLVSDDGDVHVYAKEKFNDDLSGHKITVIGTVQENRVDKEKCSSMENEIKEHLEKGDIDNKMYQKRKANIDYLRDSMKTLHSDHISFFSLEYISHEIIAQ